MTTTYISDPRVDEIAAKVINEVATKNEWDDIPKIKYLVKVAENSRVNGQCSRATGKWKILTGFDYVIEVWSVFWDSASDSQKEALLFHELMHIISSEDEDGEITWRLQDHDVEEFIYVVKKYGIWNHALESLINAAKQE